MIVESPGFVDLQVNGFAGVDFNTPGLSTEEIRAALAVMQSTGVTRCLPTLITSSFTTFAACARALLACGHSAIAGLHMEGPYISPEDGYRGAHPRAHVIPASIDDFQRRQEAAGGRIRLVTLAPEVPGALELIAYLVGNNVRVALGHTNAPAKLFRDAVAAGASLSTHLGNACAELLPRHQNVLWPQLAEDGLIASLIVDGHHLPPEVVKTMIRAKSTAKILLVTDAMAAAAAPIGRRYHMGGLEVEVGADGRAFQPGAFNLAGSTLSMDKAVALTSAFTGLSIAEVLPLASTQPAVYLGIKPAGRLRMTWDEPEHRLQVIEVSQSPST